MDADEHGGRNGLHRKGAEGAKNDATGEEVIEIMGCWKADLIARIKTEIAVTDEPASLNELADTLRNLSWPRHAGLVTAEIPRTVEQAEPEQQPV